MLNTPPQPVATLAQTTELLGVNAPAAVQAIKQRYLNRKTGGNGPDGRKLALVFDGGAMRAVGPAGGAVALAHLGLTNIFDEVYATSAGVMNASYFLSGQGDMGITIYFDDLTTGRFINPLRFWKIVDVDYLISEIVRVRKPLDVQRVLRSHIVSTPLWTKPRAKPRSSIRTEHRPAAPIIKPLWPFRAFHGR